VKWTPMKGERVIEKAGGTPGRIVWVNSAECHIRRLIGPPETLPLNEARRLYKPLRGTPDMTTGAP
jgi:hypothetical protein